MNARADGVRCQLARAGDFFVTETGDLTHQEHVAVERRERRERFVDGEIDVLRRRPRGFVDQRRRLRLPQTPAVVIQREIPRDAEQPGRQITVHRHRDRGPRHSQEDLLRQVACRLGMADRAAEIPENAVLVRGEGPSGSAMPV